MKKIVIAVMAIFAYVLIADSAMAAAASGTLDVTASVAASCNVTGTTNVAFGAYDPTSGVDNIAGAGSFSFRCVKDTPFQLDIARNDIMTSGANNLAYTLYSDAPRTVAWADGVPAADPGGLVTVPSNAIITRDIYGKIAALQDVPAGAYSETVTVNVTY